MPTTNSKQAVTRTRRGIAWLLAGAIALIAGIYLLNISSAEDTAKSEPLFVQGVETAAVSDTLTDLAARTELVVIGEVVSVELGRILNTPEEETPLASVDVVLRISRILHGDTTTDSIVIGMLGGEISSDGDTIAREYVVDGVTPPSVGTEMVWFVNKMAKGPTSAVQRYGLVSFDGYFAVENGILQSQLLEASRLGVRTKGMTIDDLAAALSP